MSEEFKSHNTIESHSFTQFSECVLEAEEGNFSPAIERNEHGDILSPNGEISRLPNELFIKITRTPAFKVWFGDWITNPDDSSKVVLEKTGEPKIMYHRTDKTVDVETGLSQENSRSGQFQPKAIYFRSVNDDYQYGQYLFPVFLNIKTPVDKNGLLVEGLIGTGDTDYSLVLDKKNLMHVPNPL